MELQTNRCRGATWRPGFPPGLFCCKTKTTREECEEKLKVLIAEMKKEIAEIKAGEKATNKG